jgi:hypothetical protein
MAMNTFPNGYGAVTGDSVVLCEPIDTTGKVVWCNSTTGSDSNAGTNREAPMKTIDAAFAATSANDTVILMDGFTQTVASELDLHDGMLVVAEGLSGGKPTCKLRSAGGEVPVFRAMSTGTGAEIRGIWCQSALTDNTVVPSSVEIGLPSVRIVGCYFECGATDKVAAVSLGVGCGTSGPDYVEIRNSTFISVATLATALPKTGLRVLDPADYLTLDGVVFSDGLYGFTDDFAFEGDAVAGSYRGDNLSLLLGASMGFAPNSTILRNNVAVRTGGGRVYYA